MTLIGEAGRFAPPKSSLEQFAPKRRAPENNVDQTMKAFEGEIRKFVRREMTIPDLQHNERAPSSEPVADTLSGLIGRVSNASMEEIDRVIRELQGVRDMLRQEGDRVSREIAPMPV
jgi:hypothetical protein